MKQELEHEFAESFFLISMAYRTATGALDHIWPEDDL
jgi:hypothetical protein